MIEAMRIACAATLAVAVAGCASSIENVPPSLETVRVLREQAVPPMALGAFTTGNNGVGRTVAIRLGVMHPPKGRTFAEFLGAQFETELKAAGKLDPSSTLRLDGVLIESRAQEDFKKGSGALGARISLTRMGTVLIAKDYHVESRWNSDWIGTLAIEQAFLSYNAMYADLVRKVLSDPEFVAAAKSPLATSR